MISLQLHSHFTWMNCREWNECSTAGSLLVQRYLWNKVSITCFGRGIIHQMFCVSITQYHFSGMGLPNFSAFPCRDSCALFTLERQKFRHWGIAVFNKWSFLEDSFILINGLVIYEHIIGWPFNISFLSHCVDIFHNVLSFQIICPVVLMNLWKMEIQLSIYAAYMVTFLVLRYAIVV